MKTSKIFFSIIINLLILYISPSLQAQDKQLEVSSFVLEENALTAKNDPVYDNNNQKCALVIIKGMGEETLRFSTGNSFIQVDEKKVDGERAYLMWIPEGVIKVTISSDSKSFEPKEYYFNPRVKKAETYLMSLHLEESKNAIGKQFLEFVIEPKSAMLEVNNELWQLSDGIAYRQLPKGKYQYQVKSKDYYTETGIVDFFDLSTKKTISISLKPNFGWLLINTPISGYTLYIDDEIYPVSTSKIKLSSGHHNIKIAKELYKSFESNISIQDNKETPLNINLTPNFSTVSINVTDGASIYIDDKFVGNNSWTGQLGLGTYKLELKKQNHVSFEKAFTINKIGDNLNFNYKALKPINGSVSIESNPVRANVIIDGKNYGTTPLLIPEIIIGRHNISLSMPDFQTISESFEIKEGQQTELKYSLKKEERIIMINSNPRGAKVYIDNNYVGTTPYNYEFNDNNSHRLVLKFDGYKPYETSIGKSQNDKTLNISLTREQAQHNSNQQKNNATRANNGGTIFNIYSIPAGASVYLDNTYIGTTPCDVNINDNANHTLKLTRNGYKDRFFNISRKTKIKHLNFELERK